MKEDTTKLFISYCWTNQDHESWVLNLAEELTENGVHVVIDKWDLKEGQDSFAFMEKMVSDPEIKKVLIISDKKYTDRANERNGGVGTETQIISPQIYNNQQQEKFVAAVVERNEDGEAYLPVYYKSRIYLDFCNPEIYTESFEKLLRWIYDKPLYKRPEIGKKPSFLEEEKISLGTSSLYKRTITGFKEAKPYRYGALEEYLTNYATNLERFRIQAKPEEYDDKLIDGLNSFLPARNEFIQICISLCLYSEQDLRIKSFHKFFETLLSYFQQSGTASYYEHDADIFKFIANELFLYYVAILLKYEKFTQLNDFLERDYMDNENRYGRDNSNYLAFYNYLNSLENRNKRLELRKLSLHATLIKERNKHAEIDFISLMQADFVLFLRSEYTYHETWRKWWPQTLLYAEYHRHPFEIFFRSQSIKYFNAMKCVLGIENINNFRTLIDDFYNQKREVPRLQHSSFSPKGLANYDKLCIKP